MDDSMFLSMVIGVGVIVLVGGLGLVMSGSFGKLAEERLAGLTGGRGKRTKKQTRQRHPGSAPRRSISAARRSGPSSSPTPRTSTCFTSRPTSTSRSTRS